MLNEDILRLLSENDKSLNYINWTSKEISLEEIDTLCKILSRNSSLKTLVLNNCNIDDFGARIISEMLRKNTSLKRLELACNKISEECTLQMKTEFTPRFSQKNTLLNKLSLNQYAKRKEVDRLNSISKQDFYEHYVQKGIPVVITNGFKDMPAFSEWNLSYLTETLGDEKIRVKVHDYSMYPRTGIPMLTTMKELCHFMDNARDENVKFYCAASPIINDHPQLKNDISIPEWARVNQMLSPLYLWVGPSDTMSSFHYDKSSTIGNIFMQVYGEKLIRLYPATERRFFSLYREKPFRITPEKCDDRVSASQIPDIDTISPPFDTLFKQAEAPWVITVRPGDVLFMPAYFWHDVRSITPSISVNAWLDIEPETSRDVEEQKLEKIIEKNLFNVKNAFSLQELNQGLQEFLNQGGNPNFVSYFLRNTSILNMAVAFNLPDMVEILLAHPKIRPNEVLAGYPYSPFCLAVEFGFLDIITLFLQHKEISPNHVFSSIGYTPLTLSAEKGHLAVLKLLLQLDNVDPCEPDLNGNTSLELAIRHAQEDCIVLLKSYSINVEV